MQVSRFRFKTESKFSSSFNQHCSIVEAAAMTRPLHRYLFNFQSIIPDKIVALGLCKKNEFQQHALTLADALTDSYQCSG